MTWDGQEAQYCGSVRFRTRSIQRIKTDIFTFRRLCSFFFVSSRHRHLHTTLISLCNVFSPPETQGTKRVCSWNYAVDSSPYSLTNTWKNDVQKTENNGNRNWKRWDSFSHFPHFLFHFHQFQFSNFPIFFLHPLRFKDKNNLFLLEGSIQRWLICLTVTHPKQAVSCVIK